MPPALRFLSLVSVLAILPLGTAKGEGGKPPHIIFILTDDQAPWALGASGNAQAITPNMDRLAREGARLTNAFTVTPVCSPSRASLMTSRYGSELGITDWIHPQREPELGLDPATPSWPVAIREAGYRTALLGKWHLGTLDRYHPTKFGFDEFRGFREGGTVVVDPTMEIDGQNVRCEGLTTDVITDWAIQFLERRHDRPFLLCIHYRAPHAPWLPVADDDMAPYEGKDLDLPHPDYPGLDVPRARRMMREYLASVRGVDRNLGRILSTLDDRGLEKDTLVVSTSDHGYNMAHNGIWHKGNGHWLLREPPPATQDVPAGQRPNLYDTSIRTPCVIRWPGRIAPGSVIERSITSLDWFPTLVEIAGGTLPPEAGVRGRSFVRILEGRTVPDWSDDVYVEYSTKHQSRTDMRAFRTREWKLLRDLRHPDRDELYDLASDPEEKANLIADPSPRVRAAIATLDAALRAARERAADPLLEASR